MGEGNYEEFYQNAVSNMTAEQTEHLQSGLVEIEGQKNSVEGIIEAVGHVFVPELRR